MLASTKPTKLAATKLAFNLSTGADTGGAAIREVEAFRSTAGLSSGWQVRSMVSSSNYIRYPQDLAYSISELCELYAESDVVHLNHTLAGHSRYDDRQGKPIVLEHHGLHKDSFVVDFEGSIAQAARAGAVQIASTANLELFAPPGVIRWVPISYDLDWLRSIHTQAQRQLVSYPSVLTIAHAPTNRAIKSTEAFIEAMRTLIGEGLPLRMLLIEHVSHAECLALKAQADVLVDQLELGYGCNAIEAWGMGIPVVGGIAHRDWYGHMTQRWGGMPLFEATGATLTDRLRELITNPRLREEYAARGTEHFLVHHTQEHHVQLMKEVYESAKPSVPSASRARGLNHAQRLALLRENRSRKVV